MEKTLKKIVYFTNTFPTYRRELWDHLLSSIKFDFHIYFSNKRFNKIQVTNVQKEFGEKQKNKLHLLSNFILNNHILFQSKIIKTLIFDSYDTVIFLGDMKIISNWIGIFICRIRKKIAFGHMESMEMKKKLKKNKIIFFVFCRLSLFV